MKQKQEIVLDGVDLLLLAGIAILSGIVVIFSFGTIWGWCVALLNVRRWSGWVWFAIKLAAAVVLFCILARRHHQSLGPSQSQTGVDGGKSVTELGQEIELDGIGVPLLAGVAILFGIGVILLSPLAWGWCAVVLNVHEWSRWVWLGTGLALLVTFVVIRSRSQP